MLKLNNIQINKSLKLTTSLLLAAILITPILLNPIHQAQALSATSISQTKGSTQGGDEIIIKGEGFMEE